MAAVKKKWLTPRPDFFSIQVVAASFLYSNISHFSMLILEGRLIFPA
jgi:hypothetical protein